MSARQPTKRRIPVSSKILDAVVMRSIADQVARAMRERLRLLRLRALTRGRLRASRSARVGAGVRASVARGAVVVLGPDVMVGDGARIDAAAGVVKVGAGAWLGERSVVVCGAGVEIGASVVVGEWACVSDVSAVFADVERPMRAQPDMPRAVSIGAGAVIGPHAVVGASVAAGARVEPYEVVGGAVPLERVGQPSARFPRLP